MKLWLCLCLLLTGCYGEVWRVDSRFTPQERADLDKAAAMWEAVGQSVILAHDNRVTGFEEHGKYIVRATQRGAHSIDPTMNLSAVGKHLVIPPSKEILIIIPEMQKQTPMWQIVAHEMGHALGLEHVDDEKALMYGWGTSNSLRCITSVDILEMCRTAGCSGSVPKGCDE